MSPLARKLSGESDCFPRVSGEEPQVRLGKTLGISFPRMSGDEPFYEKPPLDWD